MWKLLLRILYWFLVNLPVSFTAMSPPLRYKVPPCHIYLFLWNECLVLLLAPIEFANFVCVGIETKSCGMCRTTRVTAKNSKEYWGGKSKGKHQESIREHKEKIGHDRRLMWDNLFHLPSGNDISKFSPAIVILLNPERLSGLDPSTNLNRVIKHTGLVASSLRTGSQRPRRCSARGQGRGAICSPIKL